MNWNWISFLEDVTYEVNAALRAGSEGFKDLPNLDNIENFTGNFEDLLGVRWRVVPKCMYSRLKRKKEIVLHWGNHFYWGEITLECE